MLLSSQAVNRFVNHKRFQSLDLVSVVCRSCSTIAVSPFNLEDVKKNRRAGAGGYGCQISHHISNRKKIMGKSKFLELLDEEGGIIGRGEKGVFRIEALQDMLKVRAAFAMKVEVAFKSGDLTKDQRDHLVALNRRNSLSK